MRMQRNLRSIDLSISNLWQKDGLRLSTPGGFRAAKLACALLLLILLGGSLHLAAQPSTTTPIYLDKAQPIEARVDDLLRRMTLKEKVGQLNLPCAYVDALGKTIPEKMDGGSKICRRNLHPRDWPRRWFLHAGRYHQAEQSAANR